MNEIYTFAEFFDAITFLLIYVFMCILLPAGLIIALAFLIGFI